MRFDLQEVLHITGASVARWPGRTDGLRVTAEIQNASPDTLYFPVRKWGTWGSLFHDLALAKAAGVVLFSGQTRAPASLDPSLGVLMVPSPPQAFFQMAAGARRRAGSLVVGITGSSGKTSTKEYLAAILGSRYRTTATLDTNNLVTDCAELLNGLENREDAAVIEMGFGWVGDIERMASLAEPSVGVITKVTLAHLDGANNAWGTVAWEKGRLGLHVPPDGLIVMHAEDNGCGLIPRSQYRAKVLTFGAGNGADMRYEQVQCDERGTSLVLRFSGQTLPVQLRSFGDFQAANAAAASLVAHSIGIPTADIQHHLSRTPVVPQRFEVRRFREGLTVIDDTFNATVDGMIHGLANAARLAGTRRRVAFLAGIAKLGERSAEYNHLVGEHAATCGFTTVLVYVNKWSDDLLSGLLRGGVAREQIHTVADYEAIPNGLMALTGPNTLIYCKALYTGPKMADYFEAVHKVGFEPLEPDSEA